MPFDMDFLHRHLRHFMVEHFFAVSRYFEGDLEQALVLGIVGQLLITDVLKSGTGEVRAIHGIAAARIADITLIPRQTVRRKLLALQARGWIDHDPSAGWRMTVRDGVCIAQTDMAAFDGEVAMRAETLARTLFPIPAAPHEAAMHAPGDAGRLVAARSCAAA